MRHASVVDLAADAGDGVDVTIEWDGVDEFIRALDVTARASPEDMAGAMFEEGESIMAKSKADTPVDVGNLRSSARVQTPTIRRDAAEVVLSYGTDYAVFVHEIRDVSHRVGKAKFLESNMNAAASGLTQRLASRIKRRWKMRWGNAVK